MNSILFPNSKIGDAKNEKEACISCKEVLKSGEI